MNIPKFRYIKGTLYIDKETYNRDVMQVKEYKEDEIDRLNNIIDELEKWVDEYPSEDVWYEHIINKLKELKENNNEF